MTDLNSLSILIIDDSRLSRVALKNHIHKLYPDCQTDEAADADQALEMAAANSYDIFTVDINMPGMDGLELAPLLREKNSQAKLIFLTANVQDATREAIEAMGAGFVQKPIKPDIVEQLATAYEAL